MNEVIIPDSPATEVEETNELLSWRERLHWEVAQLRDRPGETIGVWAQTAGRNALNVANTARHRLVNISQALLNPPEPPPTLDTPIAEHLNSQSEFDLSVSRATLEGYVGVTSNLQERQARLTDNDFAGARGEASNAQAPVDVARGFVRIAREEETIVAHAGGYSLGLQGEPTLHTVIDAYGRVTQLGELGALMQAQEAQGRLEMQARAALVGRIESSMAATLSRQYQEQADRGIAHPVVPELPPDAAVNMVNDLWTGTMPPVEASSTSGNQPVDGAGQATQDRSPQNIPSRTEEQEISQSEASEPVSSPEPVNPPQVSTATWIERTFAVLGLTLTHEEAVRMALDAEYHRRQYERACIHVDERHEAGDYTPITAIVRGRIDESLSSIPNLADVRLLGESVDAVAHALDNLQHADPQIRARIGAIFLTRMREMQQNIPAQGALAANSEDPRQTFVTAVMAQMEIYSDASSDANRVHGVIGEIHRLCVEYRNEEPELSPEDPEDLTELHDSVIGGPSAETDELHGAHFGVQDGSQPEELPAIPDPENSHHEAPITVELSNPGFERLNPPHSFERVIQEGIPFNEFKEEGIVVDDRQVSWGIHPVNDGYAPQVWVYDMGQDGDAAGGILSLDGSSQVFEQGDYAVVAVAQPGGVEPNRTWHIQAELLRRTPSPTESAQNIPETPLVPTEIAIGESARLVIRNWPRDEGTAHINQHESHIIHIQGTKMNIILDNFDANCLVNIEGVRGRPIVIQKESGELITEGESPHPISLYILTKEQGMLRVRVDDVTYHSHERQPTTSFTLSVEQTQYTGEQLQSAGRLVRVIHEDEIEGPVIQQQPDITVSRAVEGLNMLEGEPIGGQDGILMTAWPSVGDKRKEIQLSDQHKIEFGFDRYKDFEGSNPQNTLPRLWVYEAGVMSEALSLQVKDDEVISGDFGDYKIIAVAAPSGENQWNLIAAVYSLSSADAGSRLVVIQMLENRAHDAEANGDITSALQLYAETIALYAKLENEGVLNVNGTRRIVELYDRVRDLGGKLGATPLTEHKQVLLTPELHVVTGPPFSSQQYSLEHDGGEIQFGIDDIKEGFEGITPDNPLPRIWVYQQGVTPKAISFQPSESGDQYARRIFGDCSIIAYPEQQENGSWRVTIAIFRQPTEEASTDVKHEEAREQFLQRLDAALTHIPDTFAAIRAPVRRLYELAYDTTRAELAIVRRVGAIAEQSNLPFLGPAFAGFAEFIQGTFTLRNLETGLITDESKAEARKHFGNWISQSLEGTLDIAQFFAGDGGEIETIKSLLAYSDSLQVRGALSRVVTSLTCNRLANTAGQGEETEIVRAIGQLATTLLKDIDLMSGIEDELVADSRFNSFINKLRDHIRSNPH